jgi:hypothetical protein
VVGFFNSLPVIEMKFIQSFSYAVCGINNIKLYSKEVSFECLVWIKLARSRVN